MRIQLLVDPDARPGARAWHVRCPGRTVAWSLASFAACGLAPAAAWAAGATGSWGSFDNAVVDSLFCGFLDFSKSRLAPFIAVLVIIVGVVGHWVGATKVWGTVLYVAIGVGVIMGIGPAIAGVTGSPVQCLGSAQPGRTP